MTRRRHHSISHRDYIQYRSSLGGSGRGYKTVKSKKRSAKKFCLFATIIVLGAIFFYFGSIGASLITAANEVMPNNITLKDLVSKSRLRETDGVTNVLVLGRDQAAQLTDTIQVIRIRQKDNKAAIVSIPRDLQVTVSGSGVQKINSVFGQGYTAEKDKNKKVDAGASLSMKTIEKITGLPIHYYITIDFIGLKDVVNSLGGIDVNVERGFVDTSYPKDYFTKDGRYVKTDGYETFSIKAGIQRMDGITALKYARSRHGSNGEGSDFARAARQQQIMLAIKDKALSLGFLANPIRITEMLDSLGGHIKTSMGISEIRELVNLIGQIKQSELINKVLSNDPSDGLLISVDEGGYYLKPKSGNFSEVQKFFKNIFDSGLSQASLEIEIYNGSGSGGLGTRFSKLLEEDGLSVAKVESNDKIIDKTTIYDGSGRSETFARVKKRLANPKVENYNQAGVIRVIIGSDYGK